MSLSNIAGFALLDATVTALHPTTGTTTIGTLTITAPIKVALMATNGSATAAGTEVTGGSYARQSIGTGWAAVSSGSQATNVVVSFTGMPATTTNGIELWDSNASAKRTEYGSITAKTTLAGDTLSFASGAITSAIA